MGIELLSGFGRVQPYYKASEIPVITPAEVRKQSEQQTDAKQTTAEDVMSSSITSAGEDTRSKVANLQDVSLTFNKEESFDYLGSESGLMNLDVRKAISDMRKDSILQEYQYFVGSSPSYMNTDDGIVFRK